MIWGTDVYTDDSPLGMVAVHAGILKVGQEGVVRVTLLPGRSRYEGSTRNGITSEDWLEQYDRSFRIEATSIGPRRDLSRNPWGQGLTGAATDPPVIPREHRGKIGQSFVYKVTGRNLPDWIWGTDIYTDDSDIPTAAVHAGLLKEGETAEVKVTILEGRPQFHGSTRNGVTTTGYGPWGGSYKVEAVKP
jgi:hypothetical protein